VIAFITWVGRIMYIIHHCSATYNDNEEL